jgi:hypothetical protein
MAGLDGMNLSGGAVSAVLFMQAGMYTLDAYSTLNSSPWTAESFGADDARAQSLKEYVAHAAIYSSLYCAGSAYLAKSWWPIVGAGINNLYLMWLYNRASQRGKLRGNASWADGTGQATTASGNTAPTSTTVDQAIIGGSSAALVSSAIGA